MKVYGDIETRSPVPIKDGPHAYAEKAEVMLWAWAVDDGIPSVWDLTEDPEMPADLRAALEHSEALSVFHNGGMFDFVVIDKVLPDLGALMPLDRRRDTMVQAYAHSLPGSLDKLGTILKLKDEDKKGSKRGRELIRLFCIPRLNMQGEQYYHDKASHPDEWQEFIEYAAQDIHTMRAAHRIMPTWNYREGKQMTLWQHDLVINNRGFKVDTELAEKARDAASKAKARMADRTSEMTDGAVGSATQRDKLKDLLAIWGVDLPDMKADTLERRMLDPDLPEAVRELIGIRLRASMNSSAKYAVVLRAMSPDHRLRGGAQFRGASRTGRWAHRLFQFGNMPRPAYEWPFIEACVEMTKLDLLDVLAENPMEACASMIRSVIVAPPGKKLVVADLSNIEGRVGAWLADDEPEMQKFREYDAGIGFDLYIVAYADAFSVDPASVPEKGIERQIGKVQKLMMQFQGGVGAWITGAATYGIDLAALTEATYHTLPADVREEAEGFLAWLYEIAREKLDKQVKDGKLAPEDFDAGYGAAKLKARFNLPETTFVTLDSLKRLWRRAHPAIVNYWEQLKQAVLGAIDAPGVTFPCKRLKVRRDGSWLRIMLPSGRYLCYPSIHLTKGGDIAYTGQHPYSKQWGETRTYAGKIFENVVQAVANDQFAEVMPALETEGYAPVAGIHDEWITETPDSHDFTVGRLCEMMTMNLGWNEGLPLAAKGFETYRYRKD